MPPRKSRRLETASAVGEEAETLEEYAERVDQLCPGMSTAEAILWDLNNTRSVLTSRTIDHSIGCTHSDTQTCHIFVDLKLWNEFLWIIHLELKEVVPRKLGIVHQLGCSWKRVSEIQKSHAFILLHWLLKNHHCIELLELKETPFGTDLRFLGDALQCNVGIKKLRVSNFEMIPKAFFTALATLSGLQKLALCDVSLTRHAVAELQLAIKEMPSLTSVELEVRKLNPRNQSGLLDALAGSSVAELHLPGWCLDNSTVFAKFLARNTKLKKLTLDYIVSERERTNEVLDLFGALRTNKVLEKLYLPYCFLRPSEGRFLAQVMAENNTLSVLRVGIAFGNELDDFADLIERNGSLRELEIEGSFLIDELAGCIKKNTTLRKLTLQSARIGVERTDAFLNALACNESLELVTLGNVFELVPGDFHELLEQKGLEKRVHYDCYTSDPPIHTSNKRSGTNLQRVYIEPQQDPVILVVHYMYYKLASPFRFVEVSIRLDRLGCTSARLLARYLSSTKVLESLYLTFDANEHSMPILLGGLRLNKSISSLAFEDCEFTNEDASVLGALVKESRSMQEITLLSPDHSTSLAVISELSRCLVDNYFLLSVKTNEYLDLGDYMFEIRDKMRRNGSTLLDAVQFAMGSCTKRHAEAFERHLESKSLVQKLQEVTGETEFEVRNRIKTRLRYIRYNFMTVVGVVKEKVICRQGKRQQTLIDHIGFDNLLRVVSYLKVRDIVDEPVAGCSHVPGSRMQLRKRKARP
ncbi:hypothetical protein ISCGN_004631 [Ixodes scapularis]